MTAKYLTTLLITGLLTSTVARAQHNNDATGLPGDNFSLEGALELFKKAKSPEAFEKLLNTEDNKVNNLDLNGDGDIDYIRVINKMERSTQVFILQAVVSETENQDIAVIELEKTGNDHAVVQIVGDEDIYGEETIVEPSDIGDQAINDMPLNRYGSMNGPAASVGIVVNVWAWPVVRYVYAPSYVVWTSPWSWRARPVWWRPWKPMAWAVYRPYRYHYRPHYTVVHTHRVVAAPHIYRPVRVTSVTVRTRNQANITHYRSTRTVTTANGHQVKAIKRTTTVEGRNGRKATHSTTHVKRKKR
ncbi:hypothetical protein [uncultured Chitinophaga sp.]|uniref:hypothetical protein n=1 Tax=uncultured Chitinophaga sp. TaxID=339340 RepID=UPI0025DB27DC|nr:hypothetical protein [uncultured Chitinophaga sp.]